MEMLYVQKVLQVRIVIYKSNLKLHFRFDHIF